MDSGPPRESPAKLRKKSTIRDTNEKTGSRSHEVRQLRYERAESQGFEARDGGALADLLEFVAGVSPVTSLCGDMRHLPTLFGMLKDQVPELGSRDVNLDAAVDFTEKGLHILGNKSDDQVTVLRPYSTIEHATASEMRLKDQSDAIILFEDLKLENKMSDVRCEVCSDMCLGRILMQAFGTFRHPRILRDGLCAKPFTYPPGSYNSASSQASASAGASKPSGPKSANSTVAFCTPSAS